ncbi:uncharacterized protein EI90DRAFT_2364760 [Cantharellus anzutake]|uniref:uncharacterized protein n=1 Tax=Cantharellus anzutake TaxID=1750568 RepID=UPI0019057863|nr:uncharacterized protein EI90DRAFT_2364760 [Cantharellus anzutake]KAF8324170.1 hypothetical protein EI90DRAFT_2364760 [Cantharellus anzutake]
MPGKKQPPSSSRGPKGKVPAYQLSARGLQSSRTSGSPQAPEIHITGPNETQNRNSIRRNGQDGPTGSHLEEPPSDSEILSLCCTTGWFGRWSSLNCRNRSTMPHLELSAVHPPVPDTSRLSPSHLDPKQPTRSTRSIDTMPDSASSLHSQPDRVGLDPDVDSSLEPAPGKKPIIIGTTELILQAATSALKFSPIPLLSEIPGLLLTFLQVYKTVDSNSENLKGLESEVVEAYTTILRPLQLWTGEIPPEVKALIEEFHLALEEQTKQIQALSSQKLARRIVSASDVTQRVNSVKTCINDAVTSFSTEAAILTLLHTIQSSTRSTLLCTSFRTLC